MNIFNSYPIAGIDYPETLRQFDDWFATERDCIDYLLELRWPDGFICPVCFTGRQHFFAAEQQMVAVKQRSFIVK
jgi:hypothetical protein